TAISRTHFHTKQSTVPSSISPSKISRTTATVLSPRFRQTENTSRSCSSKTVCRRLNFATSRLEARRKSLLPPPRATSESHFLAVDATTGARTNFGISHAKIYYDPSWLAAGNGLIVTNAEVNGGRLQRQLGIVAYPHGTYRAITADTNTYIRPSLAANSQSFV